MTRPTILLSLLALVLAACGGAAPAVAHRDDEVPATWTSGDDAPLGDDAAGVASPHE